MNSLEEKIGAAVLKVMRARRQPSPETEGSSSAPAAPAKLRPARFSDFRGVAELKLRGGLNADSQENWDRLWKHNPALAMNEVERPIGWVLEANGVIVGYLGNISLLYRYGGRTLTAVAAHGLVVDQPYRAMGMTLVAAFFRQKSVDLFISTSAIEAVGKIALAFKCSPVPQPDYDTVLFWVLRPYDFSCALLRRLKLAPALARIGGALIAATIGIDNIVRARRPRPSHASLAITEIGIYDVGEEFKVLWNEKQNEGCRLLADRSPDALRWHFEIPGDRGSARVICCHKDKKLLGYAVVRNDINQNRGLRTSVIADMVAKNDDADVIKTLWAAAYAHARQAGSDILEVLGFPPDVRNIGLSWNPYRRKYPACPFYYKAADPELHKILADGAAWYASPFDGDATLIRPSYSTSADPNAGLNRDASDTFTTTTQRLPSGAASRTFTQETTEVY